MNQTAIEKAKSLLKQDPDMKMAMQTAKDLDNARAYTRAVIEDFTKFFLYTYGKVSGKFEFINHKYSIQRTWYAISCCWFDHQERRKKKREKLFLQIRYHETPDLGFRGVYNVKIVGDKWSERLSELIEDLKHDLNKHIYKRQQEVQNIHSQATSVKAALP